MTTPPRRRTAKRKRARPRTPAAAPAPPAPPSWDTFDFVLDVATVAARRMSARSAAPGRAEPSPVLSFFTELLDVVAERSAAHVRASTSAAPPPRRPNDAAVPPPPRPRRPPPRPRAAPRDPRMVAAELLDVPPSASRAEIKRAFAAKLSLVHPDLAGDTKQNNERTAALVDARDLLLKFAIT
jgi:hypothetical protein